MKSKASFLLLLTGCILAVFSVLGCSQNNARIGKAASKDALGANETVVYLVRHAEKDTSNPQDQNPSLTAAGRERALALKTLMAPVPLDALYATKYARTQQTLQPLAQARSLPIREYEGHDFKGLAASVKQNHTGKTVLVAGHSNTLLPLIEALGGKKPVEEITDAQYDYLFKVTLEKGKEAKVEVLQVGAPAR